MPRNRDMQLYHQLQAKLTQQEVDYQNMHTRSTIVRAPQGKVTKFGKDQYHTDMKTGDFQDVAGHKAPTARDWVPAKPEVHQAKAREATHVTPAFVGGGRRKRENPFQDTSQPAFKRVKFDLQQGGSKEDLKREAPNQNPPVFSLIRKRKASTSSGGDNKRANTSNAPGQIQDSRLRSMYQTPSRPKQGVKRKGATSGAGSAPKRGKTTKGAAVAAARNDMADRAEDAIRRHRQGRKRFDVDLSGQKRKMPQQEGSRKKADTRIPYFY